MNAYFIIVLAPLTWAGNFVIGRAVAGTIGPIELAHWRWAVALVCLLPFGLPKLVRQWGLVRPVFWRMVLLAILSVTLFNTLLYVGLRHTEASNALLIASVLPLIILPLSKWMYDTPIRRAQVIGVSLSLLGIAAIISGGDWRVFATLAFNVGDLWVLAATLSWAFYSLWLRWKPAELSPIAFLTFSVIVGYLPLALLYWPEVATGLPLPHSQTQWLVIGYTGLFASLVAFLCWNHGVKQLGPAVAGQFIHLQMIFGTALAMLFLGEKLGGAELIGALLIGTGILLTTRRQRG